MATNTTETNHVASEKDGDLSEKVLKTFKSLHALSANFGD